MGKDTINNWIIPFLSVGKRGFKSNFDLASIFLLILKRLKTEVQRRELPIESYFENGEISWKLDMSCVQLDGSQCNLDWNAPIRVYLQVPQKSLNTFYEKNYYHIYFHGFY